MDERAEEEVWEPGEAEPDAQTTDWGLSEGDLLPSDAGLLPEGEGVPSSDHEWEPGGAILPAGEAATEAPPFGDRGQEPSEEEPLPGEVAWIPSEESVPPSDFTPAPDYPELEPSNEELYQAFVPRRMSRDRVAKMSYPGAIQMVSRSRRRGDPKALEGLTLTDEEIAAAIQDYARGIEGEADRQNWLLAQILDEEHRQSRSLRVMNTVLIVLIAFLLLGIISSCALVFVQFPNLMP